MFRGCRLSRNFARIAFALLSAVVWISYALASSSAQASILGISPKDRITRPLEICWIQPRSQQTSQLIEALQNYLTEQIQTRAGVAIKFQSNCFDLGNPMEPIGIAFYDDPEAGEGIKNTILGMAQEPATAGHPYTYQKGIWTTRELIDIVLTSRFEFVNEQLRKQASGLSETARLNLLKSIALHEVLHGFGFAHEHLHRDSNCPIFPTELPVTKPDRLLTDYDPRSIMNYCVTHEFDFETGPIPLSDKDIEGLKTLYSLKKAEPVKPYTL